jgi:hypothetical protein
MEMEMEMEMEMQMKMKVEMEMEMEMQSISKLGLFVYDVSAHLYAIRGHKCALIWHKCALMPLQKPPNLLMNENDIDIDMHCVIGHHNTQCAPVDAIN